MGLFKPAWADGRMHKLSKALESVEKETSQIKLAEIARSAPITEVRVAAIEKLDDVAVLSDIINNSVNSIHNAARLRRNTLEYLLEEKRDKELIHMIGTINDPDMCVSKFKQISLDSMKLEALGKVQTIETLNVILRDEINDSMFGSLSGKSIDALKKAVDRVHDLTAMKDLFANAHSYHVRELALGKIENQAILADVIRQSEKSLTTKNYGSREISSFQAAIVNKITDNAVLADVVKGFADYGVRLAAMKKITNSALLLDILSVDNELIQEKAVQRVNDVPALMTIAHEDYPIKIRVAAAQRLMSLSLATEQDKDMLVDYMAANIGPRCLFDIVPETQYEHYRLRSTVHTLDQEDGYGRFSLNTTYYYYKDELIAKEGYDT